MSVRLRRVVLFLAIFVMPATPAIADHHDFDGNGRDDFSGGTPRAATSPCGS